MYKCFFVKFPLCSGSLKLYSPYLMDHESDPDMPLLVDGKIVFFKTKNCAINFMRNHFCNVSYNDEPAYEFDMEDFIEKVRAGYHRGVVIDVLNIALDYLTAIKVEKYPNLSRKVIFDFADYATFHREIEGYFQSHSQPSPSELINFLYWFLGEIAHHSILYSRYAIAEIIQGKIQPLAIQAE